MATKSDIINAALTLIRNGSMASVTFSSVAKGAGITKAGLMYHYPSKRDLVFAIVNYSASQWEKRITEIAGQDVSQLSDIERYRVYIQVALSRAMDESDFIIMVHAFYDYDLSKAWFAKLEPWFRLSNDINPQMRADLLSSRYIAEGVWFSHIIDGYAIGMDERKAITHNINALLEKY